MERAAPQRADNDWGVILEKFCSILGSRPHEQVPALLLAIRRQFHWPMVEYWVNRGDGYRVICESHDDVDALNRLERESSTIVELDTVHHGIRRASGADMRAEPSEVRVASQGGVACSPSADTGRAR